MSIDYEACFNVFNGLNAKGQNRLEEAECFAASEAAKGNPKPAEALLELRKRIEDCDVHFSECECEYWNGLDRRCDCGNRRVAWAWDGERFYAEAY